MQYTEGGRKAAFLLVRHNTAVRTRGFSLIELIVVIVLMAILVGVAVPKFFGQGDFEGPAFAQELASAARYAQKLAVVSGCPVRLTVTTSGYSLFQPQPTTPPCTGTPTMTLNVKHPATGENFVASVPAGVTVSAGTVLYSAAGVPNAAATFTVADLNVNVLASGYVEVQ